MKCVIHPTPKYILKKHEKANTFSGGTWMFTGGVYGNTIFHIGPNGAFRRAFLVTIRSIRMFSLKKALHILKYQPIQSMYGIPLPTCVIYILW